jgi:hypothetical protein
MELPQQVRSQVQLGNEDKGRSGLMDKSFAYFYYSICPIPLIIFLCGATDTGGFNGPHTGIMDGFLAFIILICLIPVMLFLGLTAIIAVPKELKKGLSIALTIAMLPAIYILVGGGIEYLLIEAGLMKPPSN